MSCKCQDCKNTYKVDIDVSNAIWEKIKPKEKSVGGGLLCGSCILARIEEMGDYSTYSLKSI